ncbi:CGNR zinc finger domain-containing protein [Salinibacterium sp. SWN167]|uniref:CGNR zinc finger domain-containing protein n=1 Tax=Salinibacterium sp. SWN167 TaxID=2792054 RepID=UPI0018CCD1AC|nr:CGNR zinc finger domain-containing protein [Salinibacterium sp. SWN167]MBH0082503.1 CGNR zinc finger domain-containing protein [Salinibacterium sp. SWN167]
MQHPETTTPTGTPRTMPANTPASDNAGGATGQWFKSRTSRQWWFDSGARALDFAYTGAMGNNPEWERLHTPADLATWLEGRFEACDGTVTDRDLTDAKGLREAIASIATTLSVNGDPDPKQIDIINLFAATPDVPPRLAGGNLQAGRTRVRTGQALATMAREAVFLFGEEQHERIRECAADDCALVFYDESRSNNRRWCSMQRCGNRAKVRSHRARTAAR